LALISLNAFAYGDSLLDDVEAAVEEQTLNEVARIHDLLALPYQAMTARFALRLQQLEALPEAARFWIEASINRIVAIICFSQCVRFCTRPFHVYSRRLVNMADVWCAASFLQMVVLGSPRQVLD